MPNPSDPTPIAALTEELAALRQRVDAQAAELAQLRAAPAPEERRVSRRHLLTGLAGLGAASVAGVAAAPPAAADDGDPLLLGTVNTATATTYVTTDAEAGASELELGGRGGGLSVTSDRGLAAFYGEVTGVETFAAVYGTTSKPNGGIGVLGQARTPSGIALVGGSVAGPAAYLQSDDGVTLRLTPAERTGPPVSASRTFEAGSLSVDDAGDLWVCVESGAPGTWTRLLREDTATGRSVPITPFRALDTRLVGGRPPGSPAIAGQRRGPVRGGQSITLDLAGAGAVPASATGVFGNLIVVDPTHDGYARIRPSGTESPASSVNFAGGINALANSFITGLGPAGVTLSVSGTSADQVTLVVDVAGYLT
jgi:hypothetical protein